MALELSLEDPAISSAMEEISGNLAAGHQKILS